MSRVAVSDPGATLRSMTRELTDAFEEVLAGGEYILGRHVSGFEREWADFCTTEHAVGVSSGTDGLALALRAVGVCAGDEVLLPAMTAVATWAAVSQIGAIPIGVDIEPERNAIDPAGVRDALSARTRALVVVHLFGQPADIEALAAVARSADIPLVEDAAQAHGARWKGARVGSLGAAASFSFYPTKNLGALGDAGAVTTSSPDLAERVRSLRQYGWNGTGTPELRGVNARLDELQAAFLRVMLSRLDEDNARRCEIADAYIEGLSDLSELELPARVAQTDSVWHQFVVRHPRRDALGGALSELGIATAVHYACVPGLDSAFREADRARGAFPVAERHAAQALSLPMHPALGREDVERVIDAVHSVLAGL